MITDLEAAALGDILKHQPCTAHFVRTCFRDSPSNHFSDSAGSVYPMMKRLEKRELLTSEAKTEGAREVRYYRCTRAGRQELQNWLGPPCDETVTLTIDPIRTRILYLYRLPKAKRKKWFDEVEVQLRRKLEQVIAQHRDHPIGKADSIFLRLADENAIAELRSRLRWIADAKRQLRDSGFL